MSDDERHGRATLEPEDVVGIAINSARCFDIDATAPEPGSLGVIERAGVAAALCPIWHHAPEHWQQAALDTLAGLERTIGGRWVESFEAALTFAEAQHLERCLDLDDADEREPDQVEVLEQALALPDATEPQRRDPSPHAVTGRVVNHRPGRVLRPKLTQGRVGRLA